MKKINETTGNIGPCRLSYLNAFKPKMNELRNEFQYGATVLIPKEPNQFCKDPETEIAGVMEMIKAAAIAKFGSEVRKYDVPLKDGDKETNSANEPKYPGHWFMNVSSAEQYPPKLIDGQRNTVTEGWESGDWGVVQVKFQAYDFQGKKGVGSYLRAIQFLYVDTHFGGGGANADDFDEVEGAVNPTKSAVASDEYDPFADQ